MCVWGGRGERGEGGGVDVHALYMQSTCTIHLNVCECVNISGEFVKLGYENNTCMFIIHCT